MSTLTIPTVPTGTTHAPNSVGPCRLKWTRQAYHKLGEQGFFDGKRVQLIFGEIIEMRKQGWPHVLCKSKTAEILRRVFAGIGWVNDQSPLPFQDSEPEPDLAVIAGRIEDYSDHPTTALLIVEVADSSVFMDTTTKAELYATIGVADYWVIDVDKRQLHVFRDPAPLPPNLDATNYVTHNTLNATDTVSPLAAPNNTITVADLLP